MREAEEKQVLLEGSQTDILGPLFVCVCVCIGAERASPAERVSPACNQAWKMPGAAMRGLRLAGWMSTILMAL